MSERVFGDHYTTIETLGEGRFGVVYLCHDRKLNRRVALKQLRPEFGNRGDLQRFLAEAQRLASLTHENVIQVYDLDESAPFMVMEYFPGRTLREVQRSSPLPLERVLKIMCQVARGLQAIHGLQIIHRDISPQNIMVDEMDRVKILDLGLARDIDGMSNTSVRGHLAGTFKYMAPEVIDGRKAGFASDVFSYGLILYELVTGIHPFEAEHFMSMAYNIIERPHPPVSQLAPQAPAALGALLDRCLSKDPGSRLTEVGEAADVLQSLLAQSDLQTLTMTMPAIEIIPQFVRQIRNPYINRVMIKNPSEFFGRKHEINRIVSRLYANTPGSVSVVGDRKIGKSSLLNCLYMQRNREGAIGARPETIMVYIDLQQQHNQNMTLESFVDTVLGVATLELRGRIDLSDAPRDLNGFKILAERLQESGRRLILIMDEFEVITSNPNFELRFFSFLRYLANHYNLAYLTSSARDLQQLCHTKQIRDSPFFNIFTPLPLSVFRPEEARELIRVPSEQAGTPLEAYEDIILEMAGLFPFFLQIACSHFLEYHEENPGSPLDLEEIRRRFYEEVRLHYRFMWTNFDDHERSAILRVAGGKTIPESLRHVYKELERRHYVEPGNGNPKLFSRMFHAFLEDEAAEQGHIHWLRRLFQGWRT